MYQISDVPELTKTQKEIWIFFENILQKEKEVQFGI